MKAKIGIVLIVMGLVLLASALGLLLRNEQEQREAGEAVSELMPQIVEVIRQRQATHLEEIPEPTQSPEESSTEPDAPVATEPVQTEMPVEEIDGHGYIGFLGLPTLQQELPVMADWSYPQLKIAPCRYTGSTFTDDLVLMAHNYNRHFGTLKNLQVGDLVTFTDMDGVTIRYEVVARDVLAPTAIEEMTAGDYDLTLFTCTYGGKSRVTVRCDRMEE